MMFVRLVDDADPYDDTTLQEGFEMEVLPSVGDEIDLEVSPGEVRHYTVVRRSFGIVRGLEGSEVRLNVSRRAHDTYDVEAPVFSTSTRTPPQVSQG